MLTQAEALKAQEPVIAAALLVNTAFRLRDEESLICALRMLSDALSAMDKSTNESTHPAAETD